MIRYSDDEITQMSEAVSKLIIQSPTNNLIEIYEVDKLINLLHIRAEKYDSREFCEELSQLKDKWEKENPNKEFKVPRNQQNPNYNQILKFLKRLRSQSQATQESTAKILNEMVEFIRTLQRTEIQLNKDFIPQLIEPLPDVRILPLTSKGLEHYFHYLFTKHSK